MGRWVRERRGRGSTTLAFVVAALTAVGCGEESPAGGAATGLDGPDRVLSWTPEPQYELGGMSAPEWAAFGEITAVGFDAMGNLYVLDGQVGQVVVVDPQGGFLRTVGLPGEGPGELRFASGMVVHPDGAVTVWDPGHRGFVVYRADGSFSHNVQTDPTGIGEPAGPLLRLADGRITSTGEPRIRRRDEEAVPPLRPLAVWSDAQDGIGEWIYQGWRPQRPPVESLTEAETGGFRVRLPPVEAFRPVLRVAPLPDGRLAVADSFAYRLHILAVDGSMEGSLERPIRSVEVTEAMREAERERRLEELRVDPPQIMLSNRSGGTSSVASQQAIRLEEARIAKMGFYDRVPVVRRLAADPEGRIWVQRSGSPPHLSGPVDLLLPDGGYVGTLAPGSMSVPDAFGPDGLVAHVGADEFDAPLVRVLRLPRLDEP